MKTSARGFTLLELLLVISIIAMLASLLLPVVGDVQKHADSAACFSNLRQIGVAVNLYIADHDNTYPYIEPAPGVSLIYPPDAQAKSMADTFAPYGVTDKTLQCPADMKSAAPAYTNAQLKCSYEWRPMVDGDPLTSPEIFRRRGAFITSGSTSNGLVQISPSRVRQVTDFNAVHHNRKNTLYGDGHVTWVQN